MPLALWGSLQPNSHYPTRAIATALYQCLVYWLYQLQERNLHLRDYSAMLIAENRSQGLVK